MSHDRFISPLAANVKTTSKELDVIFDPTFEQQKKLNGSSSTRGLYNLRIILKIKYSFFCETDTCFYDSHLNAVLCFQLSKKEARKEAVRWKFSHKFVIRTQRRDPAVLITPHVSFLNYKFYWWMVKRSNLCFTQSSASGDEASSWAGKVQLTKPRPQSHRPQDLLATPW